MRRIYLLTTLIFVALNACSAPPATLPADTPTPTPTRSIPTPGTGIGMADQPTHTPAATASPPAASTHTGEPVSATPAVDSSPNGWMTLPILPEAGENIRAIYEKGLALGNDPNAFSIFGDCQARPDEFFGAYETDATLVASLPPDLRETVENFNGSFNRESSTAQDGTTPGALLWAQWHRGKYGCVATETPVACELRAHRPSFVIIQIGSHFESRNTEYLRRIINQLLEEGVVPILATKADNRELDHRVNRDMALLASEFNLPLWNFWASLNDLPNRGLYTRKDRPLQGDIYLTDEAQAIQRATGLQALDIVWRAATGK
jgi:hypothetical protein